MQHPLEDKEIQFAYSSIKEFFDHFGLGGALYNTQSMLIAAATDKVWKKGAPSRLLLLKEKLQELCSAAFTIHDRYTTREEAILKEDKDFEVGIQQQFLRENNSFIIWILFHAA